ncbi:MAG TPA: V-type ATP synthase subunit A [Longimicrobiales bacterium]
MNTPRVQRISGAIAKVAPARQARLYEVVRIGDDRLIGEVVELHGETATIEIYEDTNGLEVGAAVELTGKPLSVALGPGLLGSVLDGSGRRLQQLAESSGAFIKPGASAATLDPAQRWSFTPQLTIGSQVGPGDVLGVVQENPTVTHKVMVPPHARGTIERIEAGEFTVEDEIGALSDGTPLHLQQEWMLRARRPIARTLPCDRPFLTHQRVLDLLFTAGEGAAIALPGGFGTGKTVIEQSLARYADADIVVYVGCGERGNEVADVLQEFPALIDPRTGRSMMERTVLIVNTSNMPVAARESSIYLGLTIAEYYRDMGFRTAVMVDSISRWAEALREMAARMHELPGEEGYPAALANRLARAFERAGRVRAVGEPERIGSLTLIAAISPPGGDFSEPVTQAAMRVAGALWALDPRLANQRHFPAVNWETSYSLYLDTIAPWFVEHAGADWTSVQEDTAELLQRGAELREIAGLIGIDALQDRERLIIECAALMRDVVLAQSAFEPNDASSPIGKTYTLAREAMALYKQAAALIEAGTPIDRADFEARTTALRQSKEAVYEHAQ